MMGIEFEKQISYWIGLAMEDFEVAKILMEKKRYLHGLFFCHLVIEKSLKAIVVKIT
jgi:HEPN domain-containing protein